MNLHLEFGEHGLPEDGSADAFDLLLENHEAVDVARTQRRFVEAGVWIRPFGKLVYLMPPYIIESSDLSQLTKAIELVL